MAGKLVCVTALQLFLNLLLAILVGLLAFETFVAATVIALSLSLALFQALHGIVTSLIFLRWFKRMAFSRACMTTLHSDIAIFEAAAFWHVFEVAGSSDFGLISVVLALENHFGVNSLVLF